MVPFPEAEPYIRGQAGHRDGQRRHEGVVGDIELVVYQGRMKTDIGFQGHPLRPGGQNECPKQGEDKDSFHTDQVIGAYRAFAA